MPGKRGSTKLQGNDNVTAQYLEHREIELSYYQVIKLSLAGLVVGQNISNISTHPIVRNYGCVNSL